MVTTIAGFSLGIEKLQKKKTSYLPTVSLFLGPEPMLYISVPLQMSLINTYRSTVTIHAVIVVLVMFASRSSVILPSEKQRAPPRVVRQNANKSSNAPVFIIEHYYCTSVDNITTMSYCRNFVFISFLTTSLRTVLLVIYLLITRPNQ